MVSFEMMGALVYFSVVILANVFVVNGADDPIVQLPQGKIRGHILKSWYGNPYYAFQDIPYAASTDGSNRFQPPKEREPWTGILDTTENKVMCYQGVRRETEAASLAATRLNISEDCLVLNVFSPVAPGSSQRLPVLVWIHGGGYSGGAGALTGPKYIIDQGIVVVTINYRLGIFGFLTTDDDVMPGNLGLKDMLFAFEWVNKNIELFGGNASHVVIDGQSAGSDAVGRQLLGQWPNGKVLFHAAIMHSGSAVYYAKTDNGREVAFKLGQTLDPTFSSKESTALLDLLQKVPADKIMSAGRIPAWPIFEKRGPFSDPMFHALETQNFKKVPIIIGFCSEESLRTASQPNIKQMAAALDENPGSMFGAQFNLTAVEKTQAGSLIKSIYTKTNFQDDIGAYVRFSSDRQWSWQVLKQAELQSKYVDVYLYQFSYKGPLGNQMNLPNIPGAEKVSHGEDIRYFWNYQSNEDLNQFPEDDQLMSKRYIKIWTNFIKYFNPTPKEDPLLENLKWTKVDPKQLDNIQFLNINKTSEMQTNPRYHQKIRKILDHYITAEDIL